MRLKQNRALSQLGLIQKSKNFFDLQLECSNFFKKVKDLLKNNFYKKLKKFDLEFLKIW